MQKVKCENAYKCRLHCNHKSIHRFSASGCNASCKLGTFRCLTKEMVTHKVRKEDKEIDDQNISVEFISDSGYNKVFNKYKIRLFTTSIDFGCSSAVMEQCISLHERLEEGFNILSNIQNHPNEKIVNEGKEVLDFIIKDIVTALGGNDLLRN